MPDLASPEEEGYAKHCRANQWHTVGQRGVDAELAGPAEEHGRWQVRDEGDWYADGQDEARQVAENVERVAAEAVVDVVYKREERVGADDPKREQSQRQRMPSSLQPKRSPGPLRHARRAWAREAITTSSYGSVAPWSRHASDVSC